MLLLRLHVLVVVRGKRACRLADSTVGVNSRSARKGERCGGTQPVARYTARSAISLQGLGSLGRHGRVRGSDVVVWCGVVWCGG